MARQPTPLCRHRGRDANEGFQLGLNHRPFHLFRRPRGRLGKRAVCVGFGNGAEARSLDVVGAAETTRRKGVALDASTDIHTVHAVPTETPGHLHALGTYSVQIDMRTHSDSVLCTHAASCLGRRVRAAGCLFIFARSGTGPTHEVVVSACSVD
jgi:hypothetical protein